MIDLALSRAVDSRQLSVATPERWQVEAKPGSFVARWRWFSAKALFLVPFTIFWNGIMVTMALGATEGFKHPERMLVDLVIPHVWVGVGLAYYCLALFLNSTRVEFHDGKLEVHHGPVFWRGNRKLGVGEVQQLFVVEKRLNRSITYELCGLMRDGKRMTVLSGVDDEASARFLEVRLEQAMNIRDQPVVGEMRR